MLNSLYGRTRNWVVTFPDAPDPGMEALRRTISHLLDLEIDYYILVNMAGFVGLIDALGGVDVHFDQPMHIAFSPAEEGGEKALINVQPGMNNLSGLEALAYVRNRYRSSDYVRMHRQRCMIRSVVDQADFLSLVRSFPALAEAIRENARTNIPIDLLPDLFRYATRAEAAGITTIAFQPGPYTSGRDYLSRPIPNPSRIRAKVADMLTESNQAVVGGVATDSECE
jgi:LCP family protein required for cell wall assembly